MRVPLGGEPDAAAQIDVAGVGELVLVVHVAEHRIRHPRVNPLQHVLLVDGGVDAKLAVDGDRDHGDPLRLHFGTIASHFAELPPPRGSRVRAGQTCGFEKAVRVQPQVELVDFREVRRRGHRCRGRSVHLPGVVVLDREDLVPLALERAVDPADAVLPRRGVQSGLAIELLLHGRVLPVHRPRVVRQRVDSRPVDVARRLALLADRARVCRARDRHAPQVRGADGLRGRIEHGSRIDVAWWKLPGRDRCGHDGHEQRRNQACGSACHAGSPVRGRL